MKTRLSFVANSSSSSFILTKGLEVNLITDSLYLISRREGSLIATECFYFRYNKKWIPNYLLWKFFNWYGSINPKYMPKFLKGN